VDENFTTAYQMVENTLSSPQPPFNLSHLMPENHYKVKMEILSWLAIEFSILNQILQIEIITSLGGKHNVSIFLEDVSTTANNSVLPEEIIGVRKLQIQR